MVHYHIVVHGNVQGVGFRYFAWETASLYSINGWVRNKIDGDVEIDAEGSEPNMTEFIKAIKRGNGYSLIKSIKIEKQADIKNYGSFEVVFNR